MLIGVYRVAGSRAYRGHAPGTEFGARLAPHAEARAIKRGDLELIERIEPTIRPGTFRLPRHWVNDGKG